VSKYNVTALPGSGIEHGLANLGHLGLYAFMTIMPATGIAMGYYGGNGLPFFFTTVPGIVKTDDNKQSSGAIAKQVSTQMREILGSPPAVILTICALDLELFALLIWNWNRAFRSTNSSVCMGNFSFLCT
jgi:cytochrome b561